MTVALTGTGGLFTRIGKELHALNSINALLAAGDLSAASIRSIGVLTTNIEAQYASANQQLVDNLYSQFRDSARNSLGSQKSYLKALAENTLNQMVDDDTAVSAKQLSVTMPILITQMTGAGESVNANATSVSVATGSGNTGTAVCASSVKGPDGRNREYLFAEAISVKCQRDSQSATATAGAEPWTAVGEIAVTNPLDWNWPLGSGASASLTANVPENSRDMLANGDFEDFTTANIPDNWTISVGSAGTTILSSTDEYKGTNALRFVGNGSQLTEIYQKFNQTAGSGSTKKLKPSTVYAINCWVKVSATPAAGVLALSLAEDDGTVINNDQSVANTISKDLTTVSTSYVAFNGFFQTPAVLPDGTPYRIRLRLTTALDNAKTVYIDELCMVPATELYTGGPYAAIFAGATASVLNDSFTITVSNDWGGALQKGAERFFGMRSLGLQLPSNSAGSETVLDSLVT